MFGGVLTVCVSVFVAPLWCTQEVSGSSGLEPQIPEESLGSRGPVLPSGPCWAAGEARHGDSRMGRGGGGGGGQAWKQMSRGGAAPALALTLTGSGQCPAA